MCKNPEMRTHWEFQKAVRKLGGREALGLGSRKSVQGSIEMRVGAIVGQWTYMSGDDHRYFETEFSPG